MKKYLLAFPLSAALLMAWIAAGHSLVGHWKVAYGNGVTGHVAFTSNGHVEATFDGQTWKVGGPYKVEGNTVMISDSTCGFGYWGKYKVTWYSNDSAKAVLLEDSCSGRKMNVDGSVIVREK
jgi:hypothetical protein